MNLLSALGIRRRRFVYCGIEESPLSVSYAIMACNEDEQLDELITYLKHYLRKQDEIVVQIDSANSTDAVRKVVEKHKQDVTSIGEYAFNMDFAAAKNHLNSLCKCDFIFQLDADERPTGLLLESIPNLIAANPKIDLFKIPRNNIFENSDGSVSNFNSWPDYQGRIYRNRKGIEWQRALHEKIQGYERYTYLPPKAIMSIMHRKNRAQDMKKWEDWKNRATK